MRRNNDLITVRIVPGVTRLIGGFTVNAGEEMFVDALEPVAQEVIVGLETADIVIFAVDGVYDLLIGGVEDFTAVFARHEADTLTDVTRAGSFKANADVLVGVFVYKTVQQVIGVGVVAVVGIIVARVTEHGEAGCSGTVGSFDRLCQEVLVIKHIVFVDFCVGKAIELPAERINIGGRSSLGGPYSHENSGEVAHNAAWNHGDIGENLAGIAGGVHDNVREQ